MVKQRMVIKLSISDKKKRKKALETAVGVDGVISVKLGDDNRLILVGDGTDVVELTRLLRKKVCHAEIISVTVAKDNFNEEEFMANKISSARDFYPNYYYGVPSSYGYPYPYSDRYIEYK